MNMINFIMTVSASLFVPSEWCPQVQVLEIAIE